MLTSTDTSGNIVFTAYVPSSGSEIRLAKSLDGGDTWLINHVVSDTLDLLDIDLHVINENTIFIGYRGASYKIAKSIDGGETWEIMIISDVLAPSSGRLSIFALDESNIFASYSDSYGMTFAKTNNGGGTWESNEIESQPTPTGYTGRYSDIHAIDENTIFIGYDHEQQCDGLCDWSHPEFVYTTRLARSYDGGETWEIIIVDGIEGNDPAGDTSIVAVDSQNIFMAYEVGYRGMNFAKTSDGGSTWHTKNIYPDNIYKGISIDALDTNSVFIASTDKLTPLNVEFAYSDNGGETFEYKNVVKSGMGYTSLSVVNKDLAYISTSRGSWYKLTR